MKIETKLPWLNGSNNTAKIQYSTVQQLLLDFPDDEVVTLEVGSPYGGAVEAMAKLLGERGKAYGYDTFEGHPKDLADDPTSLEATCMDPWYHESMLGREGLSYEYQRTVLDQEGLVNAILVKGRINEHSFDDIKKAHFAILDLDLIKPTKIAYEAVKDRIVRGGYLFFHDAIPFNHLPLIHQFVYGEVIPDGRWELVIEDENGLLTGLKRK